MNIVAVMKAMGCESDQEIVQMVGSEDVFVNLLLPTLQVRRSSACVLCCAHV